MDSSDRIEITFKSGETISYDSLMALRLRGGFFTYNFTYNRDIISPNLIRQNSKNSRFHKWKRSRF
ncbi:hypothetical protein SAMN02910353_01763 [Ruminococcus sp. YRD2003]|nr:hypothetical protein SAMN02910353_01763 [Ruminococcus flavefaciens]